MTTAAKDVKAEVHEIKISCEKGKYMPGTGYRARCSCMWSSDCYAFMSDTQRAVDVHLRRSRHSDFESFASVLARSSIGAALADVKARGIDAHLADLEREERLRPRKKWVAQRKKKLSAEEAAFMRGFGLALVSILRCHHNGQMVANLIKENNFKLDDFRSVGLDDDDWLQLCRAVQR